MKVIPKEEAIELLKREMGKKRKEREDRKRAIEYEVASYKRGRLWRLRR